MTDLARRQQLTWHRGTAPLSHVAPCNVVGLRGRVLQACCSPALQCDFCQVLMCQAAGGRGWLLVGLAVEQLQLAAAQQGGQGAAEFPQQSAPGSPPTLLTLHLHLHHTSACRVPHVTSAYCVAPFVNTLPAMQTTDHASKLTYHQGLSIRNALL